MSIKGKVIEKIAGAFFPLAKLDYKVMNDAETIEYIITKRCSVARFGDGELTLMNGGKEGFQESDASLAKKLQEVMDSKCVNLLTCIPIGLTMNVKDYTHATSSFWKAYTVLNSNSIKRHIVDKEKKYGNTNFTRFYMEFKDKSFETAIRKVNEIKRIWEQRDVVMVEGEFTRCGVGNDLFDNVRSFSRIICPATNAFSKYDEILQVINRSVRKSENTLILCCLAATATCLAHDLCGGGIRLLT